MSLSKQEFSAYIRLFQFRELFIDMGWNNDRTSQPITVDNSTFTVQSVAEKSGFKMLVCQPNADGLIPDSNTRKKIENKVAKLFHEHLIIFVDANKQEQIWQLVVRQSGKPTKLTETRYHISQNPELLYQRAAGIFFEMAEEESITIVDVKKRMNENFHANAEKITKKFYEGFKKEHTSFLAFIKGIDDRANQEWYASLMLNRLMFCYFIQKKGFLDNDKNYLREKLTSCADKKGKNKFYSFYRDFLLMLFHQGLNDARQTPEVKKEIGQIPYLNGGLFDEHELEKTYQHIDIDDKAFERIFDFFDQYEWHLDTRITASGKDINPDVIGYIFEKYINERAQMGAYYTKEDITEYIGKNCIIPFLFDETKRHYSKSFVPEGEIWKMVQQSGDRYIYDAVKYGISDQTTLWTDLPEDVQAGINPEQDDLVGKRASWNKPAPADIALPTEIYRELIDRRKRYAEVKTKIENGEITAINDFITYNLNIRQFAIDVIENTNDADFLRHFYKALVNMTLLDPTCGSGAFLFAALNILEELYEASLLRMRNFTEDEDRLNNAEKTSFYNKYQFFRDTLAETQNEHHPNLCYFIYKTIILCNLYGVDIMNEAVEIAKLRLFLKLVATVEVDFRKPNMGLEPLPDIDFNIRAGNTLVGFANLNDVIKAVNEKDQTGQMGLVFDDELEIINTIKNQADDLAHVFKSFKNAQLVDDLYSLKEAKEKLISYQNGLNEILNEYLAFTYGLEKQKNKTQYQKWLDSHKPFHWFSEFYEIIVEKKGFDVVIGNPPYVVYRKKDKVTKKSVSDLYSLKGYKTIECNNLYAFVIERSLKIVRNTDNIGMIVPLTIASNNNMSTLRDFMSLQGTVFYSHYEIRPARLFDGVEQRLTIFIIRNTINKEIKSTSIIRWNSEYRNILFNQIYYVDTFNYGSIWRLSSKIESDIFKKFTIHNTASSYLGTITSPNLKISYRTAGVRYWIIFLLKGFNSESLSNKDAYFIEEEQAEFFMCAFNSNLFWWYYATNFDMFNLKDYMIFNFRLTYKFDQKLKELSKILELDLDSNKIELTTNSVTRGEVSSYVYKKRQSKPIIDEIDQVLATHYGFTQEELDFIINYDIKYRMGKELEEEE